MNRTILVTGGAGYIGSHTAFELQERGYRVVILDNLSTGHRWAIRADEFIEGDIRYTALLTQIFERIPIDAVVHFAAKSVVSESVLNPLDYYDNNVVGAQRLIQAAIFAGSPSLYFLQQPPSTARLMLRLFVKMQANRRSTLTGIQREWLNSCWRMHLKPIS